MLKCPKCGKENEDDAEFCSKCGNSLKGTPTKASFDKHVEDFAEDVERIGKKAGKKFEETAQRFGDRMDKASKNMDSWYDRTFGVLGPLISSFVGLIIVRLIVVGFDYGSTETPVLAQVGDILLNNILIIFVVMLIGAYSSYISKKYKPFRWVSPVIIAILIVVLSTIAVNIISVVAQSEHVTEFINAESEWREKYMLMVFVIIALIGYLINVATLAFEKEQKK